MTKQYPGPHCLVELPDLHWLDVQHLSPILMGPLEFDDEGLQRGHAITGWHECPKCYLWWPDDAEPDAWAEERTPDGEVRWIADGWWGGAFCERCDLLLVSQPDGMSEAYQL